MHNCARYLIFFQYIGTKYSGVVKVPQHELVKKGVQDHLEDAIRRLKPINLVSLSVSSRTDRGVHALSNSAHFDLQRKNDKPPFAEDIIVQALNTHLKEEQIGYLSLSQNHRALRVPDNFHARFRTNSRTYVYRIALGIPHHSLLPFTERHLCWNLSNTELDVGAMREAATLLVGTQDFSTFRAISSDIHLKNPVKTLDVVSIQPGRSFVHTHFHREIPFWEITFTSRSFLYKQLKEILLARDSLAYPQAMVAPPDGLFLTRVDYRETDLQFSQQTSEEQCISSGSSEE
ncbi:hypothetical protein F7725_016783 [Dissostichus mawsoni]|uniref:tRNA pseudouridine synthase n=1 Tax=Dissostichus mawsoni TaxID=36200 RepID=A0A7J5Z359_DISMA|nr:hypothetical protein F7725_016783 [Dissostichus mawsoni]